MQTRQGVLESPSTGHLLRVQGRAGIQYIDLGLQHACRYSHVFFCNAPMPELLLVMVGGNVAVASVCTLLRPGADHVKPVEWLEN